MKFDRVTGRLIATAILIFFTTHPTAIATRDKQDIAKQILLMAER